MSVLQRIAKEKALLKRNSSPPEHQRCGRPTKRLPEVDGEQHRGIKKQSKTKKKNEEKVACAIAVIGFASVKKVGPGIQLIVVMDKSFIYICMYVSVCVLKEEEFHI